MNIKLDIHKSKLQAAIDHHGLAIDSGQYTISVICCKNAFYSNNKISQYEMIDVKKTSIAYIVIYELNMQWVIW